MLLSAEQRATPFALLLSLCLPLSLAACGTSVTGGKDSTGPGEFDDYTPPTDADGDSWTTDDGDCDDANPDVFPGQEEECNGIDDNCNGMVDEAFPDSDGDGLADCMGDVEECDGLDNDGDGLIDEDWPDVDGDGQGDCDVQEECNGVDDDGDGEIDEGFDADGDGYTECGDETTPGDCDDSDASVHPGAEEVDADLIDNDCDELVDEGAWSEGDLLLTEIMQNPAGVLDPAGEWFEVYNTTDRSLVLNGLIMSSSLDGDWYQVVSDDLLVVEPGEYFVFGVDDNPLANGGVDVGHMYTDFSLGNEHDEIMLEADGVILDAVMWDDGAAFPDPDGRSMTLDPTYYSPLDNDEGHYWCAATARWDSAADFGSPGYENQFCWPTASADYDPTASLETCDVIQLDGSGSADPSGLALSFEWELVSAPAGSSTTSADIETVADESPIFYPDVAGEYIFSLTVFNGAEYSPPDMLTLTITDRGYNTAPDANAGEDETYSEDSTCTPISYGVSYDCDDCGDYDFELDGTASTDPDGDWIDDPTWTIISDTSAGATITDDDTWEPVVTVPGPSATYGATTSVQVEVELSITDCMGATSSDTVVLTHECTGI
jgi:hypothetical protein